MALCHAKGVGVGVGVGFGGVGRKHGLCVVAEALRPARPLTPAAARRRCPVPRIGKRPRYMQAMSAVTVCNQSEPNKASDSGHETSGRLTIYMVPGPAKTVLV